MQHFHNTVTLTHEELVAIVNGRFKTFQCTSCFGKGWYWVHEDGTRRDPGKDESHDDFYPHPCTFDEHDCQGLGFTVVTEI